jgi:hypothetical protein
LDHAHRRPSVSHGDVYDIDGSLERVTNPSSNLLQTEPSKKLKGIASTRGQQRRIRTASRSHMLDTDASSDRVVESHSTMNRVQQEHEPQEPPRRRQKLSHGAVPAGRYPLRGSAPMMHTSDREGENSSAPTSTMRQRTTRSSKKPVLHAFDLRRNKQVVQVLIDNAAPIQRLSDASELGNQPPSPPIVVQDPNRTAKSPVLSTGEDPDYTDSAQEASSAASPPVEDNDVQPNVRDDDEGPAQEDSALSVPDTQAREDTRSHVETRAQDAQRAQELFGTENPQDGTQDTAAQTEDHRDEANRSGDVLMPKQLEEALEHARDVHKGARHLDQDFDGIRILKSYDSLKKTIKRWRIAQDHGQSDELITLSHHITKEAKSILTKSGWDQHDGLKYIYNRVLPTLVRTLYVSLAYYLAEVKTMKRMSYEQLKASESLVRAIVYLANRAKDAKTEYPRTRPVISMIARVKKTTDIFDRLLRAHRQAKAMAQSVQRQQTQRLRQEAVNREETVELKLKEWRQRWRVLHDQRLGAEMEGQTFLNREQGYHLRHVPLDNPHVPPPHWDAEMHVYYLAEGLQEFAGPNVYRDIFRRYCRRDGPLRAFNVAEIVDKAVSLKQQLVRLAEEDEEEVDQWVKDIFDPRVPPEGLRRNQDRSHV